MLSFLDLNSICSDLTHGTRETHSKWGFCNRGDATIQFMREWSSGSVWKKVHYRFPLVKHGDIICKGASVIPPALLALIVYFRLLLLHCVTQREPCLKIHTECTFPFCCWLWFSKFWKQSIGNYGTSLSMVNQNGNEIKVPDRWIHALSSCWMQHITMHRFRNKWVVRSFLYASSSVLL